ncbi:MAG: hypothetical protein K6F83_08755, partial [Clostridiales bacterium]|nr:hypothetical protein [Clostridiales bacterium]
LSGIFFIDSRSSCEDTFDELEQASLSIYSNPLDRRETPTMFIDIISGGMYLKSYLKILMVFLFIFAYISVLIQSMRKQTVKVSVMNIFGIGFGKIFRKVTVPLIIASIAGLMSGFLIDLVIILSKSFSLPLDMMYGYMTVFFLLGLFLIFVLMLVMAIAIKRVDTREVIRRI